MEHRILAGAHSFAHLVGLARPKSAKADDDDKDRKEDARAEESDDKDDDKKDAKAADDRPADDDQDKKDAKAADDQDDPDDDEDDKNSKAKADDDDDDEEMTGKSAAAQARRRERARCAAIFGCEHAARNVALAATLAFDTTLTRKQAIGVLAKTPSAQSSPAQGRETRNPNLGAGAAQPSGKQQIAASWDAAFKKVSGRK